MFRVEELRTDEKVDVRGEFVLVKGPGLLEAAALRALNAEPEFKSEVARGGSP